MVALLRASGVELTVDVQAAASVARFGWVCGDSTGYEQISVLPFGAAIRVDPTDLTVVEHFWPRPWEYDPQPLTEAIMDPIQSRMRAVVRVAVECDPHALAELTGGRDSRAVLALASDAGVLDRLSFVTRGLFSQSDVAMADLIADRLGLHWQRASWPSDSAFNSHTVTATARLTGGQFGAGYAFSPARSELTLSGFVGEALRGNYVKGEVDSLPSAFEAIKRDSDGHLGFLNPSAEDMVLQSVHDRLRDLRADGCRAVDLPDAFALSTRIRRWLGCRADRWERHVFPLYSRPAVEAAFAAGRQSRLDFRFHTMLIERAALDLADVGFTKVLGARPPSSARRVGLSRGRAAGQQRAVDTARRPAPRPSQTPASLRAMDQAEAGDVPGHPTVPALFARLKDDAVAADVLDVDAMCAAAARYDELPRKRRMDLQHAATSLAWMAGLV